MTAPGTKVWDFDYNDLGQTTVYSHPNGLDSVFSYDGGNRMTKIELKDGQTVRESFLYALDKMDLKKFAHTKAQSHKETRWMKTTSEG